jgi:hypothetical protein
MLDEINMRLKAQTQGELQTIIRQIVAQDATPLGDLAITKIGRSAGHATAGIFHVSGRARTQDQEIGWSAVVKALGTPENRSSAGNYDPYLEVEVYRSRAIDEVCGGVRGPHCYAIQQHPDLLLLWLEDLSHAPQAPWDAHHFITTARHLGQFTAHWPEDALPQWSWLSQRSFRGSFTDDTLLHQAETTSLGICHMDCHPKNLFPILNGETTSYIIAIDWVKVGVSNLGIDIGHLLASPLTWLEITLEGATALRGPVLDAYLAGLADAGWSGNEDGVRLTYFTRLACEALRNTNLISSTILNEKWGKVVEQLVGQPLHEIAARYQLAREFYCDCENEARQLAHDVHRKL